MAASESSNRPFFVWVRKEEEKGEQFARIDLQMVSRDEPESVAAADMFARRSRFTQTYPSTLLDGPPPKQKKGKNKKKKDDDGEFICC